jgi:hypothetical protein
MKRIIIAGCIALVATQVFYMAAAVGGGMFSHAEPSLAMALSFPIRIPYLIYGLFLEPYLVERMETVPVVFLFGFIPNFLLYSMAAYSVMFVTSRSKR